MAAYIVWVNRRHQTYSLRASVDAPIEAVSDLIDIRPGKPPWLARTKAATWVDEAARDMEITYESDVILRMKIVRDDPPRSIDTIARFRWKPGAPFGDLIASRMELTAEGASRTAFATTMVVERGPLFQGLTRRLGLPLVNAG